MKNTYKLLFMISLAICLIFGGIKSNVYGVDKPSYDEAQAVLNKIPNEITLDIKESEFLDKGDEALSQKAKNITGKDYVDGHINLGSSFYFSDDDIDIRKGTIYIYTNEEGEDRYVAEKIVNVKYSNSNSYNEKDKAYVEEKTKNVNFNRLFCHEIHSDGTVDEFKVDSNFNWYALLDSKDIKIVAEPFGIGVPLFNEHRYYNIFLFKNDVLYKISSGSLNYMARITVPDTVIDTDEAYVNYARPIIEKLYTYKDGDGSSVGKTTSIKRSTEMYSEFVAYLDVTYTSVSSGTSYTDQEQLELVIEKENITLGDINNDKKVDINDAILALKHITGKAKLTGIELIKADTTFDKKVDIQDAIMMLKYIVGKIKSF